ncbi:signal peptidase II [Alkaliphilus sp. MSJ-5]|uniref:Lipoprotein signal peptidase n=1 Tax=Alkaliphilus flagellatus TaxID=2841507 RepID=A0ABS6G4C5_9FIRM|nr:signal peptidase II [Alkaliphilus flagellatus]MBU5677346.1 signal peptidase II [Alkaliphilus flagellatus]
MNYIIVIAVLILDQLSKILALKYLVPVGDIPIINNIFHLTYVENRGAAFGLFQNQKLFFVITTLLVLGFIWFYAHHNRLNKMMIVGLSLVAGGAIGNLIDRVRLGFVVDYFNAIIINFPVFNIADSAVVVGAVLIGIFILKYDR